MGFIYWMEVAPNPWVRGVAIVIIGGIAYFYGESGAGQQWSGGYGRCTEDGILYE